jgi:hypothetical protein
MFIITEDMLKDDNIFNNPNIYVDYNAGYIYNNFIKEEEIEKIENSYNLLANNKDLLLVTVSYILVVAFFIFIPLMKKILTNSYGILMFTTQVCKFFYIIKMLM